MNVIFTMETQIVSRKSEESPEMTQKTIMRFLSPWRLFLEIQLPINDQLVSILPSTFLHFIPHSGQRQLAGEI
jgi:hypothetical protein